MPKVEQPQPELTERGKLEKAEEEFGRNKEAFIKERGIKKEDLWIIDRLTHYPKEFFLEQHNYPFQLAEIRHGVATLDSYYEDGIEKARGQMRYTLDEKGRDKLFAQMGFYYLFRRFSQKYDWATTDHLNKVFERRDKALFHTNRRDCGKNMKTRPEQQALKKIVQLFEQESIARIKTDLYGDLEKEYVAPVRKRYQEQYPFIEEVYQGDYETYVLKKADGEVPPEHVKVMDEYFAATGAAWDKVYAEIRDDSIAKVLDRAMALNDVRSGDYEIAKRYLGDAQIIEAATKMYDKARAKLEGGDKTAAGSMWSRTFAPEAPRDEQTLDQALKILIENLQFAPGLVGAQNHLLRQIERAAEGDWPVPNLRPHYNELNPSARAQVERLIDPKSTRAYNPEKAVEKVLLYLELGILIEQPKFDSDLIEKVNKAAASPSVS